MSRSTGCAKRHPRTTPTQRNVLNLNAFVEITPHRCGRTIFTSVYRSPRRITAMGAPEVALGRDRSTGIMETKQTRVVFAYPEHHSLLVYLYQVMVMAT
jgi:hypothetical protein